MIREDYKKELGLFPYTIKVGEKDTGYSEQIQEWVCLHKYHTPGFRVSIAIDDDFGGATASAVRSFQDIKGLEVTGEVDNETWIALTSPMARAFRGANFNKSDTIQDRLIYFMNQLVDEHPTELGNNTGPWVRAFMKGKDGGWAAWCNGVVSAALDLAASSMDEKMDKWLPWSWSTVQTKNNAFSGKYQSNYIPAVMLNINDIEEGDLFLVMNKTTPRHIGVINNIIGDGIYSTLEGNTNDEGSREGYELCERRRNLLNGKYSIIKLT